MSAVKMRIRKVEGQWLAFASGPKWARNLALVAAINFCKRLNSKKGGAA